LYDFAILAERTQAPKKPSLGILAERTQLSCKYTWALGSDRVMKSASRLEQTGRAGLGLREAVISQAARNGTKGQRRVRRPPVQNRSMRFIASISSGSSSVKPMTICSVYLAMPSETKIERTSGCLVSIFNVGINSSMTSFASRDSRFDNNVGYGWLR